LVKVIDILSHVLVPKHRILSENESDELLEKFNVSKIQLPEIKLKDPTVIAIKSKVGDVIEITRKKGATGKDIYYRRVV